jgi:hypothetical protein
MTDTIERIGQVVELYLSGEKTYPETLDRLGDLIGYRHAHEVLRRAVEDESKNYLLQLAVA